MIKGIVSSGAKISGKIGGLGSVSGQIGKAQSVSVKELEFANRLEFPSIGKENMVYVAVDEHAAYIFDSVQNEYHCIGRDYREIGSSLCNIHYGTTEYWDAQPSLVGEKSHIYVYTDYAVTKNGEESVLVPNIKIGDGNAYLIDNPFVTTSVEELIQLHIADNTKHITEQERSVWNGKVRCYLSASDSETIVFTTN